MSLADNHWSKSPLATLDYTESWANWLGDAEAITSSSWTVDSGLTKDSESDDGTTSTVWVSGGSVGTRYAMVCKIVTNEGREDARTLYVTVEDR